MNPLLRVGLVSRDQKYDKNVGYNYGQNNFGDIPGRKRYGLGKWSK